jgi:hypothetical protein
MNKYTKKYKKNLSLTHSKREAVIKWIKKLEKGELKEEVANYGSFSRIILEEILGYDYEDNIEENVKEDYGRGLSEFALKKDGKKFMVIELKGSDADLDKPQNRKADKRTPVDQAFDYAKRSGDINWICVCNYNEFRLYNWHQKQHKFISFKAEELKDPETFKLFLLVFSKFSTIEQNLIEKLVSRTIFVERDLEDEFYKLYNETRLMLIAELEDIHSEFTREKSVHYAQLILNRYIFICFAEDLGLLPGEISVESIENPVKNNNLGRSEIWHRLNSLFIDVNEGNDFKKIYGYNGGLFSEDIEFLKIRDIIENHDIFKDAYQKWKFEEYSLIVEEKLNPYSEKINPIYKNLMTISTFNFSSEVDVNILGHIFENSIGDIEELKADTKGRRKKDGIFYTPEYITDYICRNTIIPYLSKSGKSNTVKDLVGEYWGSNLKELDDKLGKIKIIDPACGSGAFLNKAGDILLEIHKAIHEKKYMDKMDTLAPYFDNIEMRREVLLNNIYGVDLNEESVEITKLSLFLKVCKKGLKLPNLDNNIKCGNSLIDDPSYTDKPFKWEKEFENIFDYGGFDVVIGNPPYVRVQNLPYLEIDYYKKHYMCAYKRIDISILFIELAHKIIKNSGFNSYIASNQFLATEYGRKCRNFILEKFQIKEIVDFGDLPVFKDATTYVSIFIFIKSKIKKFDYYEVTSLDSNIEEIDPIEIDPAKLDEEPWILQNYHLIDIFDKLNQHPPLNSGIGKCWVGIITGNDKIFIFDDIESSNIEKDAFLPLMRAQDCYRYGYSKPSKFVIYPYKNNNGKTTLLNEEEIKEKYPNLFNYLHENKDILIKRKDSRKSFSGKSDWYKLTRFGRLDIFNKEKIVFPGENKKNKFGIDINSSGYSGARVFSVTTDNPQISLKYLLTLFNSKLIELYLHSVTPLKNGGYYSYSATYVDKIPIPKIDLISQKGFIEKADEMLELNQSLSNEIISFKNWFRYTFNVEKLSQKLEKYQDLTFEEFILEAKKKKVDIKSRKNYEMLKEEFEKSLVITQPLKNEINETDNEIDQMVYELYGLNEDEIEIIENSLKN